MFPSFFYASMVNTVRSKLPAHVTLYNILAPTAFGALVSPEKQVVDYRHYHGNLAQFVQEKNIGDVIIPNYMEAAARYNASLILNLFP